MLTRLFSAALLFSSLFSSSANGAQPQQFRDFSPKGSDYAPLENLRFASRDVQYSGSEMVDILGKSYSASKYSLTVTVTVQTLSALGPTTETSIYEKGPAKFEVFVVEDIDGTIHDELVREIYAVWSQKKLVLDHYFFDFRLNEKTSNYVLTATPDLVNVKSFYLIWVNRHAVKVVFKGFEDGLKGGWGVMDSFTSECLRISVDNIEFRAYQYPLRPQKKFVDLYEKGFFTSPSFHNVKHVPAP